MRIAFLAVLLWGCGSAQGLHCRPEGHSMQIFLGAAGRGGQMGCRSSAALGEAPLARDDGVRISPAASCDSIAASWRQSRGTLRLRGGGIGGRGGSIPYPRGGPGDYGLGTWQMPSLGKGPTLYAPIAGIVALVAFGQISDRLRAETSKWSKTTSARVRAVFVYFGLSVVAWAASAFVCWKTGLVPSHPLQIFGLFIATVCAMYKVSTCDYDRERMAKAGWFTAFAALQGVNLSVILFQMHLRGLLHLVSQAAVVTAADLTAVALVVASFPHKEWLWLRGALSAGMGLLLGANLVNMMFGSRTLHAGISYAGAALFTVGLLNNAQRILKVAAQPPPTPGMARVDSEGRRLADFDPIGHALTIYMDAVNLFFYILRILLDQEMRNESRRGRNDDDDNRGTRRRTMSSYAPPLRSGISGSGPQLRYARPF